ncbi:hypothetical protein FACS1894169_15130 [Bacteroidia bacterium]|nr:hypothetical protein FACS1894169_15130 [Bacteroidia bacterium]
MSNKGNKHGKVAVRLLFFHFTTVKQIKTMDTQKEIDMNMVTGLMDESYSLAYVGYDENLEKKTGTIAKCLEAKNGDALIEDVDEWYFPQMEESVLDIMEGLKRDLADMGYKKWEAEKFFEENAEGIKEAIYGRDDSNPLKDLLGNTGKIPVRVELLSNYDCINSHRLESSGGYSYEGSYFGDMVDALNLNPAKVKEVLTGRGEKTTGKFPDKCSRNGKEQVSYEQFYIELENSCCGANLLTYAATIDLQKLYEADFNLPEVIIPKGNACGLFSSMQGGGSLMEMELKDDVRLHLTGGYPCFRLRVEEDGKGYDYSIRQVYGVIDSFYGKPLSIISQPQIP